MRNENNEVYVLGSSRIPFVKSQTAYNDIKRKDLMVASLSGLVDRYKLDGVLMGDTALGAVLNSSADFNLAREVILSTKLDPDSPGVNLQRACGTGLEAAWFIALKANSGAIDLGIAGGVDTNSDLPIEVSEKLQRLLLKANRAKTLNEKLAVGAELRLGHFKPKLPTVDEPRTHMSMGEHCERMVKEWNISREAQDELAFRSHQRAAKAYDEGFFDDLVIPYAGLKRDGILRADTTVEKLAKLKTPFDKSDKGTLTAGNSTALTDGAASVLIGNQRGADQVNAKPLAKFVDFQNAGVNFPGGAGLLMAPTKAVSQLLTRNKLTFQDFDYFEIHEAFAGQVLCNMAAWESAKYCKDILGLDAPLGPIDISKLNVAGSSLALGHPFAATGARMVGSLSKLLNGGGNKRGLISICTAGGMGVAAILESV